MVSTDLDRSMKGSKRADQMYLGPTLGMTDAQQNILRVTTGGVTTIDRNITLVEVNFAGAVSIQLPTTVNVNPNLGTLVREPVTVVDVSGAAGANHITILPFAGELIIGTAGVVISTNWGSYVLNPMETGGWTLLDVNPSSIGLVTFETKADVQATLIPVLDTGLQILGYTTAGDGGGATYKKVAVEPTHQGKIQSLDGAWWEIADLFLVPQMFGALADDATDNQNPLIFWLACCLDQGRTGRLPKGIYRHSDTLVIPYQVSVYGDDPFSSVLKITADTVNQVLLGGGQTFDGIGLESSVTRTGGASIAILVGEVTINNFQIDAPFTGIFVLNSSTAFVISNGSITNAFPGTGNSMLLADSGAACIIENVVCDSVPSTFSHLQIISCYDLTVSNCSFIRAAAGIYVNPGAGQVVASLRVNQTFCDTSAAVGLAIDPTGTGAVVRSDFEQCWFSQGVTGGIGISGAGTSFINGITFRGCHIFDNGTYGISANGSHISNVGIVDCEIADNPTGVLLTNISSGFIQSGKIGATGGFGANTLGINLTGTTDNVYINGVDLLGNTTVFTNTASGTNNRFNPSFNEPVPTVYTPGVTSDTGTITTLGTCTGRYTVVGRMCHFQWDITITTNGTAAGFLKVTLPFTAANSYYPGSCSSLTTGAAMSGVCSAITNYAVVRDRSGAYPGADNTRLIMSGEFEMA